MCDIVISKSAGREILSLPEDVRRRGVDVLERISVSPYRHARKLSGTEAYRIRMRKCRAIIDINEKLKRIEVLRIGNRETIYL